MAGQITVDKVQLGNSATATQNFVIKTNADGSGGLYRGNVGAESQNIITWNSSGIVKLDQTIVAFRSKLTSAQSTANNTFTVLATNTEDFDYGGFFNNTNATVGGIPPYAFLPTVSGLYQVSGTLQYTTAPAQTIVSVFKNASEYCRGVAASSATYGSVVSTLVEFNGTTDYVTLAGYQASGSSASVETSGNTTTFSAVLVERK